MSGLESDNACRRFRHGRHDDARLWCCIELASSVGSGRLCNAFWLPLARSIFDIDRVCPGEESACGEVQDGRQFWPTSHHVQCSVHVSVLVPLLAQRPFPTTVAEPNTPVAFHTPSRSSLIHRRRHPPPRKHTTSDSHSHPRDTPLSALWHRSARSPTTTTTTTTVTNQPRLCLPLAPPSKTTQSSSPSGRVFPLHVPWRAAGTRFR